MKCKDNLSQLTLNTMQLNFLIEEILTSNLPDI